MPHYYDAITNLATLGPKYKIKVWRPDPKPIEDRIPNTIQKPTNRPILSIIWTISIFTDFKSMKCKDT